MPAPLHILMTADTCGGVWTQAAELCRGLSDRGHRVTLATSGGLPTADQRAAVEPLPGVALHPFDYKLEWQPDPWADVAAFGDELERLCEEVRPDVIHLNEFSHGTRDFTANGRRVPKLVVGHSDVLSWHRAVRGRPAGREWDHYRQAVATGLAHADAVAAPTAWMLGELETSYGPLAAPAVIYNGIDVAPWQEAYADRRADRPTGVFSAGRYWDEAKNVAALAAVAPRLPCPVRLAGLPDPSDDRPPPAGVEFLGRLDAAGMIAEYLDAFIYCLPARYEPFGLTPLEAAKHACVLVLGDTPSLREVWGDAAIYVPPDDHDALAAALSSLVADLNGDGDGGEVSARIGPVMDRARRYTRKKMTAEYLKCYRRLAGGGTN